MAGLTEVLQKLLRNLTNNQLRNLFLWVIIIIFFTAFCAVGATQITLQSDLSKLDPQDHPAVALNNDINTDFQRFESVVILVELDQSIDDINSINDIRDPEVMRFLVELDGKLREEPTIQNVQSAGGVFAATGVPEDIENVKAVLNQIPEISSAFDRGYEWTVVFVEADVGGDDVKIKALNDRIDEILSSTTVPGGIKVTTTGDAPLNSAIFTLLISDAFFTLIFASLAIFLLLMILERAIRKAFIVLFPLILGLIWTVGTMGWLGIPITVATAAMGAMLLGLGVEYSIFLFSRFKEERAKLPLNEALPEAVGTVGATLVSSGTTTLIGFLALSLSVFPVLSDLGMTLAIGIAYMLAGTIIAAPVVVAIEEKIETRLKGEKEIVHDIELEKEEMKRIRVTKVYEAYGKFLSQKPFIVLLIAVGITVFMFVGIGLIQDQDVDFETVLPSDLEEMIGFIKIQDEFGEDSTLLIVVSTESSTVGSNEPQDIRDPRVIRYVDRLTQKSWNIEEALSVSSISQVVREENDGYIPNTIATQREIFETPAAQRLVSEDFDTTLIRISINEDSDVEGEEIVRQVKEIIENTEKPVGVMVEPSGGVVVVTELDALNGPDSQRTSLIALAGIVVVLYILTRRVKSTVLPLLTVVLGIIWTLGLTGWFGVPFNNITSSVITMTIGIGIDFGLQIMNRFNQELTRHNRRKAMEVTITSILTPMIITVVAALIGFRAMGLGQLKIMADLGELMGYGITASMLAAVTGVAAIVLLLQRESRPRKKR